MSNLIPKGFYGEEYSEDEIAFIIKPREILGEVSSKYQTSTIVLTEKFGRIVFQDGLIYLADIGNEPLGETYTHIPMLTGNVKKKVLLIGAGDGAGVGRFLKYKDMEKIVAIDIDKDFVDLARRVMPDKTKYLDDPRVEFKYVDGAEYLAKTEEKFDSIVITVGDPFTISKTLFRKEVVKDCFDKLSDDGVMCLDGYMPFYTHDDALNYWDIFAMISKEFPITRLAIATCPLMPGGLTCFIVGSKKFDPMTEFRRELPEETVWYNSEIHKACFVLPEFVKKKMKGVKGFVQ